MDARMWLLGFLGAVTLAFGCILLGVVIDLGHHKASRKPQLFVRLKCEQCGVVTPHTGNLHCFRCGTRMDRGD